MAKKTAAQQKTKGRKGKKKVWSTPSFSDLPLIETLRAGSLSVQRTTPLTSEEYVKLVMEDFYEEVPPSATLGPSYFPTKDDPLFPESFAANVRKLDPSYFLESEEVRRGLDPEYQANPQEVAKRRIALALKRTLTWAEELQWPDELARLREVAERAQRVDRIFLLDTRGDGEELCFWFLSLHLCGRWLEVMEARGAWEATVFVNVPHMVEIDSAFFLGQLWIRMLVQYYQKSGARGKINQLLWKKRRPGNATQLTRDLRIYQRILDLTEDRKTTRYHAYQVVAREEGLKVETVKTAFFRRERPLRKFLQEIFTKPVF